MSSMSLTLDKYRVHYNIIFNLTDYVVHSILLGFDYFRIYYINFIIRNRIKSYIYIVNLTRCMLPASSSTVPPPNAYYSCICSPYFSKINSLLEKFVTHYIFIKFWLIDEPVKWLVINNNIMIQFGI